MVLVTTKRLKSVNRGWQDSPGQEQRQRPAALFLMVGFCGGFTTFSAFSLQTIDLMQEQAWLKAGSNVALSVGGCLLGTWFGFLLGQSLKKTA